MLRQRMGHPVRVFGAFDNVVPHGHSGSPSKSSAEEGAAILDALTAHVAPFLRELAENDWHNGSWTSNMSLAPQCHVGRVSRRPERLAGRDTDNRHGRYED